MFWRTENQRTPQHWKNIFNTTLIIRCMRWWWSGLRTVRIVYPGGRKLYLFQKLQSIQQGTGSRGSAGLIRGHEINYWCRDIGRKVNPFFIRHMAAVIVRCVGGSICVNGCFDEESSGIGSGAQFRKIKCKPHSVAALMLQWQDSC